jgi:hypothetical protein
MTVVLSPLRKQGDVSKIPAAPTAVLLQGSSTSPTTTLSPTQGSSTSPTATLSPTQGSSTSPTAMLSPTQGSSTSPTATLACTQGSGTSLPDTLAPSYTSHYTSGPSPCIYKREVQGLHAKGRAGERANEQAHSLSLANACNPYYEHTPWREIIRATFSPLCSISRQPI